MKQVNLISVIQASKKLSNDTGKKYLYSQGVEMKPHEIETLRALTKEFIATKTQSFDVFDGYFIGYKIPQIGKEFDLLRVGLDNIINIELKKESTKEKITKQLLRNKYYLSFLEKECFFYAYVSEENTVYTLNDNDVLTESSINDLFAVINQQKIEQLSDFDSFFHPSNYLVSPFNSTESFLRGEYFLTNQQEKEKREIFSLINSLGTSFIAIEGKAGTGKTLLAYDIAKEAKVSNKVLIIHCGQLNKGQLILHDNSWEIIRAKDTESRDLSGYDLVVVDEVQRMYPSQLGYIIEKAKENDISCIFSYDANQTLSKWEEKNNNVEKIIEALPKIKKCKLTDKVRTNKAVANFINRLFSNKNNHASAKNANVEIQYFSDISVAKCFLEYKKNQEWKAINFTPSTYENNFYDGYHIKGEDSAHAVIGQEYENVITIIDERFYYDENTGRLIYRNNPYYDPLKMLFQIVTRTRTKLCLVIVNNEKILSRCLEILDS